MSIGCLINEKTWLMALESCWSSLDEPQVEIIRDQVLRGDEDGIQYLQLPWKCRQAPREVRQAVDAFRTLGFECKLYFLPMFMVSYLEDPDTADVGLESVADFIASEGARIISLPQGTGMAGLISMYLLARISEGPIEDELFAASSFFQDANGFSLRMAEQI